MDGTPRAMALTSSPKVDGKQVPWNWSRAVTASPASF
jgi:hypothetical protein